MQLFRIGATLGRYEPFSSMRMPWIGNCSSESDRLGGWWRLVEAKEAFRILRHGYTERFNVEDVRR